jgi:uncharacterized protein
MTADTGAKRAISIVDCDVHFKPRTPDELTEHLPEPWRSNRAIRRAMTKGAVLNPYTGAMRLDAKPANGPIGSDPGLAGQQLFVDAGVDLAINIPVGQYLCPLVDPELNAVYSNAINRWQDRTWLGEYNRHGRYRGSISVPANNVGAAVREIETWAGHPGFVQVLLPHHSGALYGSPQFDPIWDAASRHHLPVALHSNAGLETYLTPVGHVQRYSEYNGVGFTLYYAAHLVSIICAGVFDRYPDMRIVLVEGGFGWYPALISRLDRNWEMLAGGLPWKISRPSSYIREHVRFSSQPVEEPETFAELSAMWNWGDAEHVLMFSTDYPHWDFDHPARAISPRFGEAIRRRVFRENATELYGLPRERYIDEFDVQEAQPAAGAV